ncbi:polyprenyl synthetase family protein [Solihabitans fulvus]|uniref:Polyprenyl synthetase family protein n=1 Tax=Solihabitans fulvus TaxID=1892852 RepID=A0A5B2XQH4_9PSEU|nr:family 2 encapsulin nanocompartment cargo protein polyprenyl transferase [Solihabitans fulvus]KAA2265673.1 polyprenyl synthetase family protein [Solihabitans fulvus]
MASTEVSAEGRPAREVVAWSRALVAPALRAAVDSLPESMRHVAGYHFGWTDEEGRPAGASGGKAIRPTLALLAADAVGGDPVDAVPAAVAVELVHNFSLLHDDVMDGDLTRRHRRTVWSVFGVGQAILVGDALASLAVDVLAASGHPASTEAIRRLSAAVIALVEGQAADLAFEKRPHVAVAECLRMAEGKTGALLGCACALGALFGGGTPGQVGRLGDFGERLGLAFQFVDDLLGIWGDPVQTGKPVFSDLQSRKKSLPAVAALASDSPAARELGALYRREQPLSGTDLDRAAELIDLAGGRAWSRAQADDLAGEALGHLRSASPTPRAAAELGELTALVVRRDH